MSTEHDTDATESTEGTETTETAQDEAQDAPRRAKKAAGLVRQGPSRLGFWDESGQ